MGLDNFPLLEVIIDASLAGDNVIVPGVAGKKIRVFQLFVVFDGDVLVTVKDGASTPLTGAMSMLAHGSIVLDFDKLHWFATSDGNDFIINLSGAVGMRGRAYYTQSHCDLPNQ